MIDGTAGGHTFVNGVCACGRKLVDLQHVTTADADQEGIAHSGKAALYEIKQIIDLVRKMRERVNRVFDWRD